MSLTVSEPQRSDFQYMTAQEYSLAVTKLQWYAREDDLIGGWCIMLRDEDPSWGGPEVGSFMAEGITRHIVEIHNATLNVNENLDE